jgi:hypothetical protein
LNHQDTKTPGNDWKKELSKGMQGNLEVRKMMVERQNAAACSPGNGGNQRIGQGN